MINGKLVEMPPWAVDHGAFGMAIGVDAGSFILSRRLGRIYTSETGFVGSDNPPAVRKPDVAFVHDDRLPEGRDRTRLVRGAPDFAVEVISPNDRSDAVLAKVRMWLDAGARLLWLADPDMEMLIVLTPNAQPRT